MAKKDLFKLAYESLDRMQKSQKIMGEAIKKIQENMVNDPQQKKKVKTKKK